MKQIDKQGIKNEIGANGEEIAKKYLEKHKLKVIEQNYLKKWGEIDLVARETKESSAIIHFVEVKTISYETKVALNQAVSDGTYRPEENVHANKLKRLHRAIQSWLEEHDSKEEWQIDIVAVRVVPREKYATVKYLENVIME